jgi:CBS domain-containing protein
MPRLTVGDVMSRSVIVVDPQLSVGGAAALMMQHKIGALPVVEGDRLVGIVTETDFVRLAAHQDGGGR